MSSTPYAPRLFALSSELHTAFPDSGRMLRAALVAAGEIAGVQQGCAVTFRDEQTLDEAYTLDGQAGSTADPALWLLLLERGLIGFVVHSQRSIVIRNLATDPRWPVHDMPESPQTGSAIGLPLAKGRHTSGAILLLHPEVDYFNAERVRVLETLTDLTATALGNAQDANAARSGDHRYQHLFDDAVVPILLTDLSGRVLDANLKACDLLNSARHDLIGVDVTLLHPTAQEGGTVDWYDLEPEEERLFRATATGLNGGERPVIIRLRRLQLEGREVIEWVEQDATAQMELEQLRRDLTAMVYHDLRGPLQSAQASLQKLGQVLANYDNMAVLNLLQTGIRSTRQLKRMVDSLLDIQRLEEGRKMLDRQPVELREMLAEAVQLVQPLAVEANQRLTFDFDGVLPEVHLDRDMIVRVVTNLIENAIKYTPEGGVITLRAQNRGDHVRISVVDSGPGIPHEMQTLIFDKFNRVKYQNAPRGVGLGLAFCRLAIRAHEGDIWVESEPGQGSEFMFTLPTDPAALPKTGPVPRQPASTNGKTNGHKPHTEPHKTSRQQRPPVVTHSQS